MSQATLAHPGSEEAQVYDRAKLGMWLFLGSEVMFFTGFIAAYIALRMSNPELSPEHRLDKILGGLNTGVLILSSLTMALAVNSIQRGNARGLRKFLGFTIALGTTFLVVKGFEYGAKFGHGYFPSTNLFYGTYFLLTGFHGLHVLAGIVALSTIFLMAVRGKFSQRWNTPVENVGLYWHFVDIVWIFLFPTLYLL